MQRSLKNIRFYATSKNSSSEPSSGTQPLGNIFDLTPEQYEELKNPGIPHDFRYKTYSSPPTDYEEEPVFEPNHLDLHAVTELMVRKRHVAAIKKARELLEPHLEVIRAGFPHHDPNLHASLRHELSELLTLLSLCHLHEGQSDLAIDSATSAALLTPSAEKFSDVANFLLEAGRFQEAIVAAERAIEMDPTNEVDALVTKASALWKMKLVQHDIIGLCDLALARDPYVIPALQIKAEYLAHFGKWAEAIKTLDRAIAKDGDNLQLFLLKSKFLEQMNKLPLALTSIMKFFKEEPDSIEAHRETARLALLTKEWDIAAQHLAKVTETLNEGYADYAYALIKVGQLDKAQEMLNLTIEKDNFNSIAFELPHNVSSLKRSLTILRKKGNPL